MKGSGKTLPPCDAAPRPSHRVSCARAAARYAAAQRSLTLRVALDFVADLRNLVRQRLVLLQLVLQELRGEPRLRLDAARRQQIHVRALVPAVLEVRGLDPAPLDQRPQAVVHLAETDTELARHLALTQRRIGLQE